MIELQPLIVGEESTLDLKGFELYSLAQRRITIECKVISCQVETVVRNTPFVYC